MIGLMELVPQPVADYSIPVVKTNRLIRLGLCCLITVMT